MYARLVTIAVVALTFEAAAQGARRCRPLRPDGGVTCPETWGLCRVQLPGGTEALLRDDDFTQEPATRMWVDTNEDGRAEATVDFVFNERGLPNLVRFDHNANGMVDEEVRNEFDGWGNWLVAQRWARWPRGSDARPEFRNSFDAAGRVLTQREVGSGKTVHEFFYDDAGWFAGQRSPGSRRIIERNDAGLVVADRWLSTSGTPLLEERSMFDAQQRLLERVRLDPSSSPPRTMEKSTGMAVDGGWLETSESTKTRSLFDASGKLKEQWVFEGGPEPTRYVHAYDRSGQLTSVERLQRYADPQRTVFTRDALGRVTRVQSLYGKKSLWDERFRYEAGRVVSRDVFPGAFGPPDRAQRPFRAIDVKVREGLVREVREARQHVHFEYDLARLERWRSAAPVACTSADSTDPLATYPRPISGPLVTSQTQFFFDVPAADAGVLASDEGQQLAWSAAALGSASLDKALEAEGLELVLPVDARALGERAGVLVAEKTYFCHGRPRYVFDRKKKTLAPLEEKSVCPSRVTISMKGRLGAGGCGTRPPDQDWFVPAPRGTTLEREPRVVEVALPVCVTVNPLEGFLHPP